MFEERVDGCILSWVCLEKENNDRNTTNKLYTSNSAVQLSQLKDFQELEVVGMRPAGFMTEMRRSNGSARLVYII